MNMRGAMKTRRLLQLLPLIALIMASRAEERVFVIPNEGWRVVVDAPPMAKIEEQRRGADYAIKGHGGPFNLSLFVETPQSATGGYKECCEFYWSKGRRNPQIDQKSVQISNNSYFYRVEYVTITLFKGEKFRQKHVNYYFVFKGRWMDLHISVFEPKSTDEEIFRRFDQGLRYEQVAGGEGAAVVPIAVGRMLAGNKIERIFQIPGGGTLVLAVPAAWQDAVVAPRDATPGTMTVGFTCSNANGFRALLSLLPKDASPDGRKPVGPQLRSYLEGGRRMAQATAEEKELVIRDVKEGEVVGGYYKVTDRTVPRDNPQPGQARYMLQASIMIGGRVATMTALSNAAGGADLNEALEMARTARCP